MTKETKLGMFMFAGLACFVLAVMLLGDFQFQRRYALNITFKDIAGLPAKAKVKIAGVEVGNVRGIKLESNRAKVTVWINRDIEIHGDARASIVATGIIGSKYLELTMGSPEAPLLQGGETLIGVDPVSFDKMIAETMGQIDELVKSLQGNGGRNIGQNIYDTLDNLREITGTLRHAITDQEQKVVDIVSNINSFTRDLAEITADNKENLKVAVTEIRSVAEKLDVILARIEKGEGTIGKLVSDKEMGENLKTAFSEIKETATQAKQALKRVNMIQTDWSYQLRYDTDEGRGRNDFGLYIRPRPGKYYYLGGSNLGDKAIASTDTQEKNTFSLLFGKQWKALDVHGGVIRSKAGVGAKVRPLYKWDPWRRLELTAEGYDFGRETPVNKSVVNAGARVEVTPWLFVGAQKEDISHTNHSVVYGNIVLRDDDIAYILGLVGLARP